MSFVRLPQVELLASTNLNKEYHHSLLIALLRGLAAVEVAAAHLRAQVFPGLRGMQDPTLWYQFLAFITGFSHQAVVVFFLLSGWLVGGSFLNRMRERHSIRLYAVDRLTRLWIVLIPACALSLIIAAMTGAVDPASLSFDPGNAFSVTAFLGNLFGVQDLAVPRFGGNFALWSLANETWYYVLVPLLVLSFVGKSISARMASAVVCLCIALGLSGPIVLYFSLWLLGAGFSRLKITASALQKIGLACLWAAIAVYFRLTDGTDMLDAASYLQHLLFSLPLLLLLSGMQTLADPGRAAIRIARKVGNLLAGFSFTLYVIHVPLLILLNDVWPPLRNGRLSPHEPGGLVSYLVMLVGILAAAYLFHLPFEAQTHRVRSYLKRKLFGTRQRTPGQLENAA